MIYVLLSVFGLIFGSFVNALVWRIHGKKDWIKARSQCPHCHHELAAKDLVPIISWLWLHGSCRYCHKPISKQYPIVELATAVVFVLSYIFWPSELNGGQWLLFIAWLLSSVGLMALLVYDLKWMLLPNKIVYPTLAMALVGHLIYIFFLSNDIAHSFWLLVLSLLIASGLFWILFYASGGKWIGYGDVRLGLILGTVLAKPSLAFLMIFTAAILGTLATLPALITGQKSLSARIPFGPFLITATWLVLMFGQSVLDWYQGLLT